VDLRNLNDIAPTPPEFLELEDFFPQKDNLKEIKKCFAIYTARYTSLNQPS
jgi:hypothetical protein